MVQRMVEYWVFPVDADDQFYLINEIEFLLDDLGSSGECHPQGQHRIFVEIESKYEEDLLDLLDTEDADYEAVCE